MKICITGGAGMIGSTLTKKLMDLNHEVLVIDNLWRGKLSNLVEFNFPVEKNFHNIDLSEQSNLTKVEKILEGCDVLIHLADIVAGIGYVFNNQYDIFRINNLINTNIFQCAKKSNVQKILYAGTACSFPKELQTGTDAVLDESQLFPSHPESMYGWSKLIGSLELNSLLNESQITGTTLLLHNVYGPNCDWNSNRAQVIPSLIKKILINDLEIDVWGSGEQGRAFIHVADICDAFIACLSPQILPEFIQIGPKKCTTIKDLVKLIITISDKRELTINYDKSKPEGDRGRCADSTIAKNVLGWSEQVTLEDGLKETYEWIKKEFLNINLN